MDGLNIADVWEAIAAVQPEADALVHGERRLSWREVDRRAEAIAGFLVERGIGNQDRVALYLSNDPAYLESLFACCKASLVPVNTNYHYADDELVHLWDDADAAAIVFHGAFVERIERTRARLPGVRAWLWVDDGSAPCPGWAVDYGAVAEAGPASRHVGRSRSGRDLVFLYTGGTTGLPKGVMWPQDLLVRLMLSDVAPVDDDATAADLAARSSAAAPGPCVVACPLMHGTGLMIAVAQLLEGGAVVTVPGTGFQPEAVLDAIGRERAERLAIVGDAFARPIVAALDAEPGRWDLSSLAIVGSSGAMWSEPVKAAMLRHQPAMVLLDFLSASEALGIGTSISTADATSSTARFAATDVAVVITDDGRLARPGSGEIGRLGVRGIAPVGYHKDPEKSAATFPVIDGVRYSLPGDWATIEADGTITLLGRGSVCINTGGEKVFPEEVEEALKTHPTVADAVVVGVPDDRFGEVVVGVVEPEAGTEITESDLVAHVRARLATYKAPRHVVVAETIGRSPNGKVDYRRMRAHALERLGAPV